MLPLFQPIYLFINIVKTHFIGPLGLHLNKLGNFDALYW